MAKESPDKPIGLTKDTGWQIGARRTIAMPLEAAWRWVVSDRGVKAWLGNAEGLQLSNGVSYELADGTRGEVRVFKKHSHLRITWHPPGWSRPSTIQVRVTPKGDSRTVLAFHQEHMPDQQAREDRRAHFLAVLEGLESVLGD